MMQPKHRILAVDDDPVNLAIMEEIFGEDYDLATAASGEDCLELAPQWEPELILLDLMMPGIDGYETCRRLRGLDATRNTKIVLVSARAMLDDRIHGYEAGADDYVSKPFDEGELLAKVRVLLRLHAVETIDQLKSRFLNLLAHETRTPLSKIMGPAQILQMDDSTDPETVHEYAGIILDSAREMQGLVDRAVLLCAFRANEAHWDVQEFDLSALVSEVSRATAQSACASEVSLRFELPESLPWQGDPEHLAMVVETIVHNAFDHRTGDSEVEVVLFDAGSRIRLAVTNEGDPIPPERIPHLFSGFDVVDVDHHSGHLGLNLSLAREIVQEHSGTIEVQSASGARTVFTVDLPRMPAPSDTPPQNATVPEPV
mgnify:CR=1 FL=1